MSTEALDRQLAHPDPDGTVIALYRTRAYRFTDDPRHYVLAEVLEERYAQGHRLASTTASYVKASLNQIRSTGELLAFNTDIAEQEGIDLYQELEARAPYAPRPRPECSPEPLVFIVGAPRSGTSHLYNCLAHTGRYAYFTTASCWAWPVRNLTHPARRSFETMGSHVLTVDNKNTRIIPGLVMPYEAEDLYTRAIPTYRHLGGHAYDLSAARVQDASLLTASIQAHCRHFGRDVFLTKSPFNCLRIPQLDAVSGHSALFLHITRDQAGSADSMRRNHFRFYAEGIALTEEAAWEFFTSAVIREAPKARTLTITHADLLADQTSQIAHVEEWIKRIGRIDHDSTTTERNQ